MVTKPSRHPLYKIWSGIFQRCRNPRNHAFPSYGGRGILVCDRWNNFDAFAKDMGPRPSKAHSIDRIDNDGHYEPGNCRWATRKEQARNTRNAITVVVDGVRCGLADLADERGLKYSTLIQRFHYGMTLEQILFDGKLPNIGEKAIKARIASIRLRTLAKSHCPLGHELTPENTVWDDGGKRCKLCRKNQRAARIKRARMATA